MLAPLLAALALSAPVPKPPVPKLADVFGVPTEAKGMCTFELSKDRSLTVTVPAEHRWRTASSFAPPLVAKEMDDDFRVTVRVRPTIPDDPGFALAANPRQEFGVQAGLSVCAKDDPEHGSVCVLSSVTVKGWNEWRTRVCFIEQAPRWGASGNTLRNDPEAGEAHYLRITRRGVKILQERSTDGEKWELVRGTFKLAGPVTVGPVAFQSTHKEFTATFDEYQVESLPKDDKK